MWLARPTEVPEVDVYICESMYDEVTRQTRKLGPEGLRKYTHSPAVTEDEIYFFRRLINPPKVSLFMFVPFIPIFLYIPEYWTIFSSKLWLLPISRHFYCCLLRDFAVQLLSGIKSWLCHNNLRKSFLIIDYSFFMPLKKRYFSKINIFI